jgi:hypothetical protein
MNTSKIDPPSVLSNSVHECDSDDPDEDRPNETVETLNGAADSLQVTSPEQRAQFRANSPLIRKLALDFGNFAALTTRSEAAQCDSIHFIKVHRRRKRYQLLDGRARWEAAKRAGLIEIFAQIGQVRCG